MSELITIARPYAKAAFDFAIEHNNVAHWQSMLAFSVEVSRNERIVKLLSNISALNFLVEVFIAVCGDNLDTAGQNLIRVMGENRRIAVLPTVLSYFIFLRMTQEVIAEIDVISVNELKEEQLVKISAAMEQRLSRKVKINCKIDKSIMAGVIICTGDTVIDGSVRGRLERLADALQV